MGYTKATTNDWDIRPSVAIKVLSANISWTAEQIYIIELALESAHQSISNDILVSLPILIALRHVIYHWKQINKHFPTQVQLYKSVQPFMRY